MSLNGLDGPAVVEAYQTALAEAGGWLLLKYVVRDEVALLGRGTGGVPEIRQMIESYGEQSPLYGFLQYRRRKVVLKYAPVGISRLVQARTTVQFQSVLDRFSPQDTIFSLATSSELTESSLSSACLLHAASGSMTSSSSSLRRRRLMEIAEDAEECGASPETTASFAAREDRQSLVSEATAVPSRPTPKGSDEDARADSSTRSSREDDARTDAGSIRSTTKRRFLDQFTQQLSEPRKSSQSLRPSLQDLDAASLYRPKVKLGPRPAMDLNGRPRTAGGLSRNHESRLIATLPSGLRSASRKSGPTVLPRPQSQSDPVAMPSPPLPKIPPVPPLLIPPPTLGFTRPPLSPGAKSMTAVPSSGMTLEKQRLMKALELRRKQMERRSQDLLSRTEKRLESHNPTEMDVGANEGNTHHPQKEEEPDRGDQKRPPHGSQRIQERSKSDQEDQQPPSPGPSKPDSAVELTGAVPDRRHPSPRETSAATPVPPMMAGSPPECTRPGENPQGFVGKLTMPRQALEPARVKDASAETHERPPEGLTINPTATIPPALVKTDEKPTPKRTSEAGPTYARPTSTAGSSTSQLSESTDSNDSNVTERKTKRKAPPEPIQIPAHEFSDEENLLSDDSFMEELKTAQVQEAKPVSVGKAPLSPNGQLQTPLEAWRNSRAVSSPTTGGELQALPVGRSISTSCSPNAEVKPIPVLVAKKINVSSGISKRIKALEMFSNSREANSNSSPGLPTVVPTMIPTPTTSAFELFRKRTPFSPAAGPSVIAPVGKPTSPVPLSPSASSESPARAPLPTINDSPPPALDQLRPNKKNLVSVTARIVRDSSAPAASEPSPASAEPGVLNLQRSPLIVECDQRGASSSAPPVTASKGDDRRMSVSSSNGSKRDSLATVLAHEGSGSSRSSRSKMDDRRSRSTSDAGSSLEEKRESRKSRIFRRMSSITSSPRKSMLNTLSSMVKEEDTLTEPLKETQETPPEPPRAVDIGEANVQFPGTLLWKRRFLRVDDQGYLILTPGNMDSSTRSLVKRYHLSVFKTPCLPDEDRQELPNSILLDFCDGNTLQCACESRQGQAATLQTLVNAHSSHRQS